MTDETPAGGFATLGLDPKLVESLTALGYEEPTPIQKEAIPLLLEGRDLVGLAATGTGKTAAFALPLIQRLAAAETKRQPAALILVPTRELAMQVAEAVHKYGKPFGTRVLPVYGGAELRQQARSLERGVDVVVATPGRALDHLRRGTLKLKGVSVVVLDEADEMLDMGFAEDIDALLGETPKERQTMLFSATMPPRIEAIAKQHLNKPANIRLGQDKVAAGELPRVRQVAYLVPRAHKVATLVRVLDVEAPAAALIFCRTRTEVDELAETLSARGYRPEAIHGGLSQEQRDRVMRLFRAGTADLLVATDVAARGLDVEHLSHVVNFHIPAETEAYVHRIGRVGRAGREGVAITLAEPKEHRLLKNIERATGRKIEVGRVPTVADLRTRRLERTREAIEQAIEAGDLDHYRVVIEALSAEHDIMDIALAATQLAHKLKTGEERGDEEEIPAPPPRDERDRDRNSAPPRGLSRHRGPAMGRLFLTVGRMDGVTPRDLVGAIAHEAGVPGPDIGAVDIAERFSIVEVPEDAVEYAIECLQGVRIRGRRVNVRRDRRDG
jgi:ATP-dependent RNA helicase DeaD